MKQLKNKAPLIILAFVIAHAVACQSENTLESDSGLFAEVGMTEGTVIDNSAAVSKINAYCGDNLLPYLSKIAGEVSFQAGYVDTFKGSGYTYALEMRNGPDGKEGRFRANEGQMFGSGMFPPSKDFRHDDLLRSECEVTLRSLSGQGGFEQVEAREGTSLTGGTAHAEVSATGCVSVKMLSKRLGTKHSVAFCPNSFFQEALSSGFVTDDQTQLVIHPKA